MKINLDCMNESEWQKLIADFERHLRAEKGLAELTIRNYKADIQPLYDYMLTELPGYGETSLLVVEGIFNGALPWSLPGGELNFAVGAQLRSETYKSGPGDINDSAQFPCTAGPEIKDCTTNRSGLFGFLPPSAHIDEDRDIYAVFGELQLPVADSVEAQLSVRFEDYGGATGSSVDPKLAIRWQALPSIGMRASVGTTFRGPTLNAAAVSGPACREHHREGHRELLHVRLACHRHSVTSLSRVT